ncbi:hypothetical protein TBLA_0B00250 [Henningerozyma blattae CBS 6284]|uniref:Rab-GAP TBC domain-containing protein n=1 Tax=Henningerozyma blattae (strain ATCC 34711 / CBS 6284 / DSM 70876 / NBRC 10599 / NRRL Y-10934 / UCD 77-7) TaxID=1071380 RepID=I2GXL8_HENB6|nr:hypothetical protein TBLA_0B00250 [Tetrapisispora blattae CBS 6284]CCH58870.1 hypothetical protein TBLA_0B00250 [Tetrapisispora blattae CBS 6284]
MVSQLLFCKSKVFVHPTRVAQDNVPGYLLVTYDPDQQPQDSSISWIPESGLSKAHDIFLKNSDLKLGKSNDSSLTGISYNPMILTEGLCNTWSFTVRLSSLYSLQFRLPSPSGWWFGSLIIYAKSPQETETFPVLFFHDDQCQSTIDKQKELNKSMSPFGESGEMYWGGADFRNIIRKLVDLQKTKVDPTVWLINATLEDLRNFSPESLTRRSDGIPKNIDPLTDVQESFWNKWESTKWSMMAKLADATSKTGSFVGGLIRKHPLVKLAEKNSDNPYVQKLLKNEKVQEIQDDFDSARIYLAKWALGVKEQSERYQQLNRLNDTYRKMLTNELDIDIDNNIQFTNEELNKSMERNFPLTKQKWDSLFDSQGRLTITVNEMKDFIFHGGIETMELKKEVWLFLFNVYPWDSSNDERLQINETLREIYENDYKSKWVNRHKNEDPAEEEYWQDQIFRIEKDVKRNDRHIDIYKYNTIDGKKPQNQKPKASYVSEIEASMIQDESNSGTIKDDHIDDENLEALNEDEGETNYEEQFDEDEHWKILNPNLQTLRNILISYNIHNSNLGYVQGMTDLLSPLYYIIRDEALTFWCFVNFMERMERNFLRDQSGIRDQMLTLSELCNMMLPKLNEHLNKCDSSNLFFCFRFLLVWFKREFSMEDICYIWENFLTDYYSSQYQLFFMLAILQKNSNIVIDSFTQFDQVLKYFNDIQNSMDWKDLMIRSELLFIKFRKSMELLERKKEMLSNMEKNGRLLSEEDKLILNNETKYLSTLLSKKLIIQTEGDRTIDSLK